MAEQSLPTSIACVSDNEEAVLLISVHDFQYLFTLSLLQTTELIDVYCFGHLLYEMTFGKELEEDSCDNFPPECPAQLRKYFVLTLSCYIIILHTIPWF